MQPVRFAFIALIFGSLLAATAEAQQGGSAIRGRVTEHTGIRPHTVQLLQPGTLPRTSSGKLRRSEALRLYLTGELQAPRKPGAAGMVLEMARSMAALAITASGYDSSNSTRPGRTTATQCSGLPLPEPMRVSAGFWVTGLSGKTLIQTLPPRLMWRVMAIRAASI